MQSLPVIVSSAEMIICLGTSTAGSQLTGIVSFPPPRHGMQYTVDAEKFDEYWDLMMPLFSATAVRIYIAFFLLALHTLSRRSKTHRIKFLMVASCLMAVLGTIQMAITTAATATTARFVQTVVHAQVLRQPDILSTLGKVESIMFGINKRVFLLFYDVNPAVSVLRNMGIPKKDTNPTCNVHAIHFHMSGPLPTRVLHIVWVPRQMQFSRRSQATGRILWIRRATSHLGLDTTSRKRYDMAITIIIESGAIYCVAVIFLVITASLDNLELHYLGIAIGGQVLNIIPTFTVVYIGLHNAVDTPLTEPIHQFRSYQHSLCPFTTTGATMQVDRCFNWKPRTSFVGKYRRYSRVGGSERITRSFPENMGAPASLPVNGPALSMRDAVIVTAATLNVKARVCGHWQMAAVVVCSVFDCQILSIPSVYLGRGQ
ncbi:hypothetical protein B0H19DRAFT_1082562 [Mycena capillaripes]|nr:hypothetical protein B0H19DRAFT_1082562 [Mycena capillaripes]